MGRRRTWTDDDLRAAVAASTNLRGVFLRLGLVVGGASWVAMQDHIERLGAEVSHWSPPQLPRDHTRPPLPDWSDADLRVAFEDARSVAQVMRRLGLDPASARGRRAVERDLVALGLVPSSLDGQGWATGRVVPPDQVRRRPLSEILVNPSDYRNTSHLKRRLIAEGVLAPRCASCETTRWLDQPVPLHLDHIDGDRRNNLLANLRLLCPNCHALTDTYCGRNIGARYSSPSGGPG